MLTSWFKKFYKSSVRPITQKFGFDIIHHKSDSSDNAYPDDFTTRNRQICNAVRPYTLTSPERVLALTSAVQHILDNNIPGSFVECGVWRGGSAMAMMMELIHGKAVDRDIYLYDTYTGMPLPSEHDVSIYGETATTSYRETSVSERPEFWCESSLSEVKKNVLGTGYPAERIHFIEGKVEDTMPEVLPESIALLRLDTDWYDSTIHELRYLYPVLCSGGILIIDDYGHWQGARKAVDEFFAEVDNPIFLNRIDYSGRLIVKP